MALDKIQNQNFQTFSGKILALDSLKYIEKMVKTAC